MKLISTAITAVFLISGWHQTIVNGFNLVNATDSVLGCTHNGTRFANGSFVPTIEPCLNCKCINANLICALRICPEQPFPPPRGCVIVKKRDSCCPYITCSKLPSITSTKTQDKNVITHDRKWYEQHIKNRIFSQNALQRRIDETVDGQLAFGNDKMCVHNGTVYRSGSAMSTSSLCSYCYCIGGKEKCVQPKCTLPDKGCEPIFVESSCCPIRYDCTPNKVIKTRYNSKSHRRRNGNKHYLRMTSRMQRSRGCLVQSTFYPEGHKLPSNETNPCEICFCIGGSKRCTPKKCAPMIKNCMPIIPDGQCCPSSYECNYRSKEATTRELTPRQYDLFSLLFGDENKENSTASSWDYESETEIPNIDVETKEATNITKNEKGFFDAFKEGLSHIDGNGKVSMPELKTNINGSSASNYSSYNDDDDDDDDEEDEEEISLLDFFLNGDSALKSTTPRLPVFEVTGKPLANGMTNSPMKIQPVMSEQKLNESIKFAMLPVSLYNMVKDDGSIMFENKKPHEIPSTTVTTMTPQAKLTDNLIVDPKPSTKSQAAHKPSAAPTKVPSTKPTLPTSVKPNKPEEMIITPVKIESTTKPHRIEDNLTKQNLSERQTTSVSTASTTTTKAPLSTTETTTKKLIEKLKPTIIRAKPTSPPSTTFLTNIHTRQKTTTSKKDIQSTTPVNLLTSNIRLATTQKPTPPPPMQILTTGTPQNILRTTSLPKTNPSIIETDINYDYSEPTLPPSLPNLKIIPFLPTDAVRNSLHKGSGGYKPNVNYYQHQQPQQSNQYRPTPFQQAQSHVNNVPYSPFNINSNSHDLYNANKADDRIDFDGYKPSAENQESLDYIYATADHPSSIEMTVNSHLGYGTDNNNKKHSSGQRIPSIPNKNLTVKPPLPPFEPEFEYDLYNLPPNGPPTNNYNEYHLAQHTNDAFSSEHNYNVPHFVTMPPLEKPVNDHRDSVFSYKSNFIPPIKTEGGFVPKPIPALENYIPLHGDSFYSENGDYTSSNQTADASESDKITSTANNEEKNIISITTDTNYKYSDSSIKSNAVDSYETQPVSNQNELQPVTIADHHIFSESNDIKLSSDTSVLSITSTLNPIELISTTMPTEKSMHKNATNEQIPSSIPLKLITILHNTKKENPSKAEIPQRKNNKIIDPTGEPLLDATSIPLLTTELPKKDENPLLLRDMFISLNRPSITAADISDDLLHKSAIFLQRPINKLSPSFISSASFPGLTSANAIESKHNFQSNPIRSELDLIIPELNKNKQTNDFSHTNNFSSENYQVIPADDTNISNTESYVVNPVDVGKLKQSHGETQIFTPPHKDPAGLFKLDGCNIYGRMYRVDRIIAELSSPCLECRCTEVGVACTPLNC